MGVDVVRPTASARGASRQSLFASAREVELAARNRI